MVQSLNDQTTVSCPVCGHYNDADATVCGACAFALSHLSPEEKVDAILEDLLDLSKAPMAEEKPVSSPTPEEPDVDEVTAEQLFDSLLIEIHPSPAEEAAEDRSLSEEVAETPPAREAPADEVPIPVLATPAETEGRKMIRISGRMFDGVTYASVGALVAVFIFFRMYANPFDLSAPFPMLLFAGIAAGGMLAALLLFRISNSAVAQGDHLAQQGRRVCAHGPFRGRGQVPHESDEAPTRIRRGVVEPGRSARPSGRPRRSAKVPRARAIDFTHGRGLETSYGEDVDLGAGRGGCRRLDAPRRLEALAAPTTEISVAVPLEHFHHEPALAAQRTNRKRERRIREVEGLSHIERPVAAQFRGHVAHHDVRGLAERLEQLGLNLRALEVAAKDLDAFDRGDRREIDGDDAPLRPDALAGHLGPAARRGSQVHDDIAPFEQAISEVNLGQLDCGAAAVRLLLRSAVESIVLPCLDPGFAHQVERCWLPAITLSPAAGLTC